MQRLTLIGNIGKDFELKYTETKKKVVEFSVAVREKINDNEITTWFNCEAWEGRAEILSKYVKKGDEIYLEGKIRNKKYKNKEGQEKNYTYLLVDAFKLLRNERKQEDNPENNRNNKTNMSSLETEMKELEFY